MKDFLTLLHLAVMTAKFCGPFAGGHTAARAEFNNVRWVSRCRDLVQLPVAA